MNAEVAPHVHESLEKYSDLLFTTAITVYVLVMILFLVALAGQSSRKRQSKELVGAAAGSSSTAGSFAGDRTPGRVSGPEPRRDSGEKLARMAYPVIFVGILAHLGSIVVRGVATERVPWGNMYEFISLTCLACVVAATIALRKPAQRPLLGFVMIPVVLMMFAGGKFLYTQAAPVVPALKSYWLAIHVSVISVASGILLTSGVASILYLFRQQWKRTEEQIAADETASGLSAALRRIADRIPSSDSLDRVAYKCVVVGFPLLGLGIIFGAIWAERSWGRFWGWDPKETVSFISWIIYAAYLHARATAGWKTAAAWINVAGFAAIVFNLFFINLVVSGLHSYAGL
ncbi:MAG: c-type cytochrome biogenesis protein CcsB [Gordonia sp. (in: high G+C Gram-positive bacteria)]